MYGSALVAHWWTIGGRLVMLGIRWPISTKSCRPLMVDHPRSTMIGRLVMIYIQWPSIGHSCSTINGQPLLVNHLILNRYPLVGKGFLCMIFLTKRDSAIRFGVFGAFAELPKLHIALMYLRSSWLSAFGGRPVQSLVDHPHEYLRWIFKINI